MASREYFFSFLNDLLPTFWEFYLFRGNLYTLGEVNFKGPENEKIVDNNSGHEFRVDIFHKIYPN